MASRWLVVALCALLVGCNASGRPVGTPQPQERVSTIAVPTVPESEYGQIVGGEYMVAPGDTLAAVSDRTSTPIQDLIAMNNLQPPYALSPGMRLSLKQHSQYVVQREDTLSDLAQRYGVSQGTLIAANNLQAPYVLRPGQRINIPSPGDAYASAGSAAPVPPATPAGAVAATPLPAPGGSTVTSSGGVSSTSMTAGTPTMSAGSLPKTTMVAPLPPPAGTAAAPMGSTALSPVPSVMPKANTMTPAPLPAPATSTMAPPPTTLQGSAAAAAQTAKSATMAAPAALPATPTAPVVSAPQVQANAATTQPQDNPQAEVQSDVAMESAPAAGSGNGQFAWPVQGKVIGAFGTMKDGTKNDGINIAAPAGAPVFAAADGVVAYAGNELRGFGNMILIRHDGGYVTAYAHNASLLVKKGDKVKRGQTIARVGATGAVFGPQLHFEIRKGTQPVDPMTFLGG